MEFCEIGNIFGLLIHSNNQNLSLRFNEEMIETLFGYVSADKSKPEHRKQPSLGDGASQYVRIIAPKNSQNSSILLKALNVTLEEVCDALLEGKTLSLSQIL